MWPRKVFYGVDVTVCIHGTELMDAIWYMAGVIPQSHSSGICVRCTLYSRIHLMDFMLVFVCNNPQIHVKKPHKTLLASQSDFDQSKWLQKLLSGRIWLFADLLMKAFKMR
jgi:hypothetical protein